MAPSAMRWHLLRSSSRLLQKRSSGGGGGGGGGVYSGVHGFDREEIAEKLQAFPGGSVDLLKKRESGIAVLTVNYPSRMNAFSGSMMVELEDRVSQLESWADGKGVIVRGAAGTFCSGSDLNAVRAMSNPQDGMKMCMFMQNTLTRLLRLPLISVALVEGRALGGGAELATACDFRLMASGSAIQFVHKHMGLVPGWGGAARLCRIVGSRNALKLLGGALKVDPELGLRMGLADGVLEAPRAEEVAGIVLRAEEGAGIVLRAEEGAGIVLQAEEGAGIVLQAEEGAGTGIVLQAEGGAGTGIVLQAGEGAGIVLQAEEGAGIVLQAEEGAGTGIVLQAGEGAGTGIVLQAGEGAGTGIVLRAEEGAGIVLRAEEGAGIVLQAEEGAGIVLQAEEGAGTGIVFQAGEGAGIVLQAGGGAGSGIVLQRAESWLGRYTNAAAPVVRAVKKVVLSGRELPLSEALRAEKDVFGTVWGGPANLQALAGKSKHR